MSALPGRPDLDEPRRQTETRPAARYLVADAEDLIARQYADRPHLRAVFDAVLAVLPALPGPVTVQARSTLVSLVSPRRTFAVLKPTTKSRVDARVRLTDDRDNPVCARLPPSHLTWSAEPA